MYDLISIGCTRNACFPEAKTVLFYCDCVVIIIFFQTMYNKTIIIRMVFVTSRIMELMHEHLPWPWLFWTSQKHSSNVVLFIIQWWLLWITTVWLPCDDERCQKGKVEHCGMIWKRVQTNSFKNGKRTKQVR